MAAISEFEIAACRQGSTDLAYLNRDA